MSTESVSMNLATNSADAINQWQPAGDYWPNNALWWNPWPTVQPVHVCPTYPITTTIITQQTRCAWCQGQHTDKCPNLKAVTYRADGTVERIEFFNEVEISPE